MSNQAENFSSAQNSSSTANSSPMTKVLAVFERAKAIIMRPALTWLTIKDEPTTIKDIYKNYLAILALVPALCTFIAVTIIGVSIPFYGTWRAPFFGTLVSQIISYAVSLGMVYVAAVVIEKLGPKFEAKTDTLSAFKLVAYSMTPAWVAGVFHLLPGPIALLGMLAGAVYSIYVFLLGVQPLTGVPEARKTGFVTVSALVIIALGIIIGFIVNSMSPRYDAPVPQMMQNEQLKQFEESMKALQKSFPDMSK